ncbi:MAG: oxygen-dependent coproporphyrinogen oxidase [Bradymonadia bacterium]
MNTGASVGASKTQQVRAHLQNLQHRICGMLEEIDGSARFAEDEDVSANGSLSSPRIMTEGPVVEKAAVNFSHSIGAALPKAATDRRPEFAGCGFQAVSLSLIVHPRNPYAPTTHANFRFFQVERGDEDVAWWFGGGYDLTPYYGFEDDAVHWHQTAKQASDPFGDEIYPKMKTRCDDYFYIPHRKEARGIGGIFFDDWNHNGFEESFSLVKALSNSFLPAYQPILERRKDVPYTEKERAFQLFRRGRYAEFNLVYDRGTQYGLQSGRRTETVMASMPPLVAWHYKYPVEPGSPEHKLYTAFLPPRDWVGETV